MRDIGGVVVCRNGGVISRGVEGEKVASVRIGAMGYLMNVFAHEMACPGVSARIAFCVPYLIESTKFRLCLLK